MGQIADTVVMKPPFGTRKKGADREFLYVALKVASQAVYSLLLTYGNLFLNQNKNLHENDVALITRIRDAAVLKVTNKGDRPIQVGSHYHFIEVNPSLIFDRRKAYGMRLNIPAGTTTRLEPGDAKSVTLVKIGGMHVIRGGNAIADNPVTDSNVKTVMESALLSIVSSLS
uniref:Urease n=1 Tax=Lactuca sativa TaxID=4236 RepID=A0A9R1WE39_LACSA|nr:hypothetical protein LSAT_V11C200090320 [Lactuca sativa]